MKTPKTIMPLVTAAKGAASDPPPALPFVDRQSVCVACSWNVGWKCEHPGCSTCAGKQRGETPLLTLITKPNYHCPMRKF